MDTTTMAMAKQIAEILSRKEAINNDLLFAEVGSRLQAKGLRLELRQQGFLNLYIRVSREVAPDAK